MFKTIKEDTSAEIIEKKSRFIANVFYIENVEEAEEKIKEIKKKYFDARHNCFAYRIATESKIVERFSDDGEPSGTAGAPMLTVLAGNNLANILVVVTRYFGGTLLGTGGLIRAYTLSVKSALEKTNFEEKVKGLKVELQISYQDFEKFKYYCTVKNIKIYKILGFFIFSPFLILFYIYSIQHTCINFNYYPRLLLISIYIIYFSNLNY